MSEGKRPEKFLGKYRLLRKLGHGGMGVVYEAEDTLLERIVALKILPRSLAADAQAMTRFRREAQAAHRLAHPNVVALFDINQQDSHFFIAMELMPGGTTHDQLRSTGAYPWPRATQIITDACRGLTAAHENGILHRDVKPSNLLLSSDGRCKLADFGLAKAVDQTQSLTTSGTVVGTPNYMSPEQCRSEVLDHRSDIYALGATYFALLVGRPPYVGNGPMEVMFAHCSSPVPNPLDTNATIDPRCASIVQRAMAKEPAERFATTREMLTALEAVTGVQSEVAYGAADSTQAIDGLPDFAAMAQTQSSDAISARERPQRRTSSIRPGLIAAIVLGVVALGVGAIVVVVNWNPSPETTTTSTEPPTRVERPRRWSGPITAEGLSIPMDAMVSKVAFSNEGTLFAAACANAPGGVDIWTFPDGEPVVRLWRGRAITALVGQPNGFAALAGDRLLLWHRTRGESEHRLPTSGRCLALSPDNRRAAVGLAPSTRVGSRLLEISLADGSTIWEETAPPGEEWVGVDYAGSLRQLAAATDSNIHLWESANRGWEKLHILPAGNGDGDNPVTAIVVGIDRQAGDRPVLAIATEEYLRDWLRHRGGWNPDPRFDGTATREDRPIWDIALGDDGQLVAWVVRGRAIRLYHRGREGDRSLGGHRGAIRTLAFAPGSRYLASGADDETVRLWDLSEQ